MNKLKNTTLANSAVIVQFIHPGLERPVEYSGREPVLVPWVGSSSCNEENTCSGKRRGCSPREKGSKSSYDGHSRRLVIHDGEFVNEKGNKEFGKLAFWTEWEAETKATRMPNPSDSFSAKWRHTVVSPLKASKIGRQNTDPCVFGKSFKYCCCQQRKNNILLHLGPDSLILFGSKNLGTFYLDTVFVVSDDIANYDASNPDSVDASLDYKELTVKRIGSGKHTFYRGRTIVASKSRQMYSFAPARRFIEEDPTCGARCKIDIGLVNGVIPSGQDKLFPKLGRFHRDVYVEKSTVFAVWSEILRQVRENGFVPAVHFDWPM